VRLQRIEATWALLALENVDEVFVDGHEKRDRKPATSRTARNSQTILGRRADRSFDCGNCGCGLGSHSGQATADNLRA
jgi:hypothetical protein